MRMEIRVCICKCCYTLAEYYNFAYKNVLDKCPFLCLINLILLFIFLASIKHNSVSSIFCRLWHLKAMEYSCPSPVPVPVQVLTIGIGIAALSRMLSNIQFIKELTAV